MGKGGAIAILLVVLYVSFACRRSYETSDGSISMAVTSAASAELIGVSSLLCVFDTFSASLIFDISLFSSSYEYVLDLTQSIQKIRKF